MTEQDWLSLTGPEDLYGELAAVVQPRKLFQLGAAFLTRVRDHIRDPAVLFALDVTREYVAGTASVRDLLERWTAAELATQQRVWTGPYYGDWTTGAGLLYGCPCCEDELERLDAHFVHPSAREGIRVPAWFASHASSLAQEYAAESAAPKDRARVRTAEQLAQWRLFVDLVGDPLARAEFLSVRLPNHPAVGRLLSALEREDRHDPLTILALADAVEEAGCTDAALLSHLREAGPHFAGCWAVERVAGRELIELPVDDEVIYPLEEYRRSWWGW